MNVLYIHTHDSGRNLHPYGYPVRMPNLMRLAREGTVFRQAYCAAPTCSPSRCAMLTGVSAHACGMTGLTHRGFSLTEEARERHLANFLARNGYETVLAGIQHEIVKGREADIGYTRVLESAYLQGPPYDRERAAAAARFIREADRSKPFFLSIGFSSTHREFPRLTDAAYEQDDTDPRYVRPPHFIPDNPQTRIDAARFALSAHVADECIGTVLGALEEAGLDRETLILYTTDHGVAFPYGKCTTYDTGIGVALILKYPGNPAAGKALDALVSHLDVYPTLCEILGLTPPEGLEGHSLVPLMAGEVEKVRDEVFAEVSYHAGYDPERCVRTERYKLIRLYGEATNVFGANIDDGESKAFMVEAGLLRERRAREMLFDLYLDPVERVNLVHDRAYRDVYEDLSQRLYAWMERTNDPLWHHRRVPKPEGARISVRTAVSAKEQVYE